MYGQCHRGRVTCIAVGKEFYFTAGDDGAMRVWNRRNLEFIGQYSEHTKTVTGQCQYLYVCTSKRAPCACGTAGTLSLSASIASTQRP